MKQVQQGREDLCHSSLPPSMWVHWRSTSFMSISETDLKHKAVKPRKSYLRASALGKVRFCWSDLTITSQQRGRASLSPCPSMSPSLNTLGEPGVRETAVARCIFFFKISCYFKKNKTVLQITSWLMFLLHLGQFIAIKSLLLICSQIKL